ncbi:MAG TPA: chemotaxis protein CheB [Terriglobales bacterium]|nr:chemotaxis protein CheB [Terriglobales bacterium]
MPKRDIVVVGASAGGIGVLQTVLSALPWNLHAAIFVVLHTTEDSPGLLPEILNRKSRLPVLYAVHNAPIFPCRIYIAPSGRHMLVDRNRVRLTLEARENRLRPSVDTLFRSASYAYADRVIGVVLTGNLDDGSAGLADIKTRGGLAIVQDPQDAAAPSMPGNAIEATNVDFILPAEEIGPKIVELTQKTVAQVTSIDQVPAQGAQKTNELQATGQFYSCPECGGVLEELPENGTLRYRCRVGHIYSPESLLADQSVALERALWAAIRSMEEQAEFSQRLAENSQNSKRLRLARRFSEKASSSRENANVLRDLLQPTADQGLDIPDVPEQTTGTE